MTMDSSTERVYGTLVDASNLVNTKPNGIKSDTSLDEHFQSAVQIVRELSLENKTEGEKDSSVDVEHHVRLYAFYKQATTGPCNVPKPAFYDVLNFQRWKEWSALGEMPLDEAKRHYLFYLMDAFPPESFGKCTERISKLKEECESILDVYSDANEDSSCCMEETSGSIQRMSSSLQGLDSTDEQPLLVHSPFVDVHWTEEFTDNVHSLMPSDGASGSILHATNVPLIQSTTRLFSKQSIPIIHPFIPATEPPLPDFLLKANDRIAEMAHMAHNTLSRLETLEKSLRMMAEEQRQFAELRLKMLQREQRYQSKVVLTYLAAAPFVAYAVWWGMKGIYERRKRR